MTQSEKVQELLQNMFNSNDTHSIERCRKEINEIIYSLDESSYLQQFLKWNIEVNQFKKEINSSIEAPYQTDKLYEIKSLVERLEKGSAAK